MTLQGMGRQLLFIDLKELEGQMYTQPGQHILVMGATGSGKSSSCMKIAYNLWKAGETVIWRDDANLEFLSFLPVLPVKLYIPEGCDLHLEKVLDSNLLSLVEKVHYDWRRPMEVMPTFDNEKLNVLLFDLYTIDLKVSVQFWTNFFWSLYRYKREQIKEPWSLIIDELNDLAPGRGRGTFEAQLRLSSQIFHALKKFRKMNLRLVGSTHNFNDLHAPLRGQFNYYIIKRMRREHVPSRFINYAHLIERMKLSHAILVDRYGNFQFLTWTEETRWHRDPERLIRLRPKKWKIPWSGEITAEEEEADRKGVAWRKRCLLLLRMLDSLLGYEVGYRAIQELFELSPSYAHHLRTLSREIPEEQVEEALSLLSP